MTDLKAKPFYLQDEDIEWVNQTLAGMTLDEKVGQLFCLIAYTSEEEQLRSLARDVKAGGVMCRPMPTAEAMDTIRILQENSKIPMLISANLEAGGNGIAVEGTRVGSHMQIAATEDDSLAYKAGAVCGREGSAVGANWGSLRLLILTIISAIRLPIPARSVPIRNGYAGWAQLMPKECRIMASLHRSSIFPVMV